MHTQAVAPSPPQPFVIPAGPVAETLAQRLQAGFSPQWLELENESHRHAGGAGRESHFRVVLVSDAFAEQSLIGRHRRVMQALADLVGAGCAVHALSLQLLTPEEWTARGEVARGSPECRGGGK